MSAGFEELAVERGPRSGALMAVVVHSTRLGPALGGARIWHYPDNDATIADAMRLAESMTHKAAAAGLNLGGGKGVIATPQEARPEGEARRALLLDFGDLVDSLEGRYVTAEDVGSGAEDMEVIAERTAHVVGRSSVPGGSGDPSPVTALGVRAAMRACAAVRYGSTSLAGRRVVVIGLGHVGTALAALLRDDGAEVAVTDIDPGRRPDAEALGARWLEPVSALRAECEILAPCALGGLIDEFSVDDLRCHIVCGAANNVLADRHVAALLAERDVLYAPDFIANAGGLMSVYGELRGLGHEGMVRLAEGIEQTMYTILSRAGSAGVTPLEAALEHSRARLEREARISA